MPGTVSTVAAIILAGGRSARMGDINKLLVEIDGVAMIRRIVDGIARSKAAPLIVVTGFQYERVRAALAGCAVRFAHNEDYAHGLSTSLRRGLQDVPADAAGAVICLGDMPRLEAAHVDRLIDAFRRNRGEAICVPVYRHRRGNPVLWPRAYFAEMQSLSGDTGAKSLIERHRDRVVEVAMADESVLSDIDTPEDLKRFQE
ncbi:MAG: nucleotidyltransferase family protein [Rhodospirillales bacterium]